ncbi:MAG: chloride channel protein, partial [Acidobacteriaceae bacterium]
GNRWYVLAAADLTKIASAVTSLTQPVEELLPEDRVPILYPDLPLNETLAHFYRWPLLPIVNRAVSGLLEGTVTQADVLQCYERHAQGYK